MRVYDCYRINDKWWKLFIILLPAVVGIVAGCATQKTQPEVVARTVVFEPVANLKNVPAVEFELISRIAVRSAQQRFSGKVHWQHTGLEETILLLSPLGQAVAEINKNENGVSLVTSKQETFHARDVEDLTVEILGWRLPVKGLRYWIQGLYSPLSTASVDLDRHDRIISIRQDGWKIALTHYTLDSSQSESNQTRPRMIDLQFEDLNIRMVIDRWIEV